MSVLPTHEKSLEALGNLLKTKREINGLTRRDMVVKTKIPLEQLESIEDGRLSSLPPVFAKGFLRAYANELGLDAEAVLEDYRQMTGGFKNEPASSEPLAQKYVDSSVGSKGWKPGPRAIVITLMVIAALVASFWLWPGLRVSAVSALPFLGHLPGFGSAAEQAKAVDLGQGGGEEPGTSDIPDRLPGTYPEDEIDNPGVNQFEDPGATRIIGGPLSLPQEVAGTDASTADSSEPEPVPGGTLVLSSNKDGTWLQVIVDNRAPEFILLNSGEQVTWKAKDHIIVTAGQPDSVLVNWNGQDIGTLGDRDSKVVERRFPRS